MKWWRAIVGFAPLVLLLLGTAIFVGREMGLLGPDRYPALPTGMWVVTSCSPDGDKACELINPCYENRGPQ